MGVLRISRAIIRMDIGCYVEASKNKGPFSGAPEHHTRLRFFLGLPIHGNSHVSIIPQKHGPKHQAGRLSGLTPPRGVTHCMIPRFPHASITVVL